MLYILRSKCSNEAMHWIKKGHRVFCHVFMTMCEDAELNQ